MGYSIVRVEDVERVGAAAKRVAIAGYDGVPIVASGNRRGSYELRGPF